METLYKQVSDLSSFKFDNFGQIPNGFTGSVILMDAKKWGSFELEMTASILLTIIFRKGDWHPVSWVEFLKTAGHETDAATLFPNANTIINQLVELGDLEVVYINDGKIPDDYYIIPTYSFFEVVNYCIMRTV